MVGIAVGFLTKFIFVFSKFAMNLIGFYTTFVKIIVYRLILYHMLPVKLFSVNFMTGISFSLKTNGNVVK